MTVKLPLDHLLEEAIQQGGSVVHLEPGPTGSAVRIRKHLALLAFRSQTRAEYTNLWQNLLDKFGPANLTTFFEGSFRFNVNGSACLIRVSMIPTAYGASVVMKINSRESKVLGLDEVGLGATEQRMYRNLLASSRGLVLLVTPPGGGGSTLFYTSLGALLDDSRKILTMENPVEVHLPGVQQIEISSTVGGSQFAQVGRFDDAFRALEHQDFDVVGISTLRDAGSAGVALQSALTGALVLTRVHALSPMAAIRRLAALGLDLDDLLGSLRGMLCQILLRRNCPSCRVPVDRSRITEQYPGRAVEPFEGLASEGKGCRGCSGTGIAGVYPVHHLISLPHQLEALVRGSVDRVRMPHEEGEAVERGLLRAICRAVTAGEAPVSELVTWLPSA